MDPLRRHLASLDPTAWTGFVVLAVGMLGGAIAVGARLLLGLSAPVDVSDTGAYASIFMITGIVLYIRGEG